MKNWREETQPELPQAALDARDVPLAGGEPPEADRGPDGAGAAGRSGAARASGAADPTGATEVLPVAAPRDPWGAVLGDATRRLPVGGRDLLTARDPHTAPGTPSVPGPLTGEGQGQGQSQGQVLGSGWPSVPDDAGSVRIRPTGAAEVSDAPVFVDASGRRSRRFRRIGTAVGLACAVYAVVIVVTLLSGSSDAPWLPVPGQNHDRPAGKVDDSPRPARSAPSSGDDTSVAGPAVSGDGTTPSARVSSRTPGAGRKDAGLPSASTPARPTPSGTAGASPNPGSSSVAPSPSASAPTSDTPAPPASSPAASPSESAAPTGGPVAEGAAPRTRTSRTPVL
ncbi:hypothetical protein QZN11_08030 [Streptomyces gramineus]|uniref:hypothetical protein n=1 Tax=Streptomyces gramineus TaxID=910542 RepID=UPI00398ADABA